MWRTFARQYLLDEKTALGGLPIRNDFSTLHSVEAPDRP
jgi:hypothetical protein